MRTRDWILGNTVEATAMSRKYHCLQELQSCRRQECHLVIASHHQYHRSIMTKKSITRNQCSPKPKNRCPPTLGGNLIEVWPVVWFFRSSRRSKHVWPRVKETVNVTVKLKSATFNNHHPTSWNWLSTVLTHNLQIAWDQPKKQNNKQNNKQLTLRFFTLYFYQIFNAATGTMTERWTKGGHFEISYVWYDETNFNDEYSYYEHSPSVCILPTFTMNTDFSACNNAITWGFFDRRIEQQTALQ